MKFEVTWISLKEQIPDLYQECWTVTRNGKVTRDRRIGDTYFGHERLNWEHKGFQDRAEFHHWDCLEVIWWAPYVEPESPEAPKEL